jgi:hypothetical protein
MPTCTGCGKPGDDLKFADYPKKGRLFFCNQKCQNKFHVGEPKVMSSQQKHICINAVVEWVIDHQSLAVRFIPYGLEPVKVRILQYLNGDQEMEYNAVQYRFLSAMLDPREGEDGQKYYAICHVDVGSLIMGKIEAVVHVPHQCEFDENTLMVRCSEGGKVINLSKVMTEMTFENNADHAITDSGLDEYKPEARKYVSRDRPPMHLHLKKGAFTKQLKQQHRLKGKATRIPESTIKKVLHSKKTSKLERERAQFAENARHWHHGGSHHSTPATPETPY